MKGITRRTRPALAGTRLTGTLVLAALATALLAVPAARASAPPGGLIVVPHPTSQPGLSYFKITAPPGYSASLGTVELRNPTPGTIRVALAGVDGATLGTLGSSYAPPGSTPHASTLWLVLGRRAVTLPPRSSATVPVRVRVPAAGRPGDYLSGISIEQLDQRRASVPRHGASIASVERYAIGVEVTLPGPRVPRLQFTGAQLQRQPAGLVFLLDARNPGNVILQGVHGSVRITLGGHVVLNRAIEPGTFVTRSSIAYPVTAFTQAPNEGASYDITAWLKYPGGIARLHTSVTFGHRQAVIQQRYGGRPAASAGGGLAWWKIAGALVALLYAATTTALLVRRRAQDRRAAAAARATAADIEGADALGHTRSEQESQPV
jgi:hypothetical protein